MNINVKFIEKLLHWFVLNCMDVPNTVHINAQYTAPFQSLHTFSPLSDKKNTDYTFLYIVSYII